MRMRTALRGSAAKAMSSPKPATEAANAPRSVVMAPAPAPAAATTLAPTSTPAGRVVEATDDQRRWRARSDRGVVAPPVEIDALVIDELIRSGFLPARDFHQRSEIAEAAAQALRVWATYR